MCQKKEISPSCTKKKTVDIDILLTSRNGDKKIMQFIRITSRPPTKIRKGNQFRQFKLASIKVLPTENKK